MESQKPICLQDYVAVYDVRDYGDHKQLGHACSTKFPERPFVSSWNEMKIEMVSDDDFNSGGFMAEYYSKTFQIPNRLLNDITFDGKNQLIKGLSLPNHAPYVPDKYWPW